MAYFEFEGDTKDISERQLEFVSGVLGNLGYKNEKITVESVGKAGDNFMASVKRFIVHKEKEPFQMVAKVASDNEIVRKSSNTKKLFRNEHLMYTEVLPKFAELEKEADLPESERLRFAACYGSFIEEPNEIILLEDLSVSNFTILDKYKSLSSENVKLVLRSFAILHSLSYVLKNKEPETFKYFCKELLNIIEFAKDMKDIQMYMNQLENDVLSTLENDKHKSLVMGSLTQIIQNALKNIEFYKNTNYSIIQQGDSWTNNIMFRLENEKVAECCMIDYQLSNENSPVADLTYMIFNCTDYETRSKYYHEWIDYYHTELDKRLSNFGLKALNVYSRERLDADLRRQAKQAIGQSIMLASMMMKDHREAEKYKASLKKENGTEEMLNASRLSAMKTESMIRFKGRLEGLINSFIELGYL